MALAVGGLADNEQLTAMRTRTRTRTIITTVTLLLGSSKGTIWKVRRPRVGENRGAELK